MRTLKIRCEVCNTLLATVKPSDNGPHVTSRGRWSIVNPPDAPEERWTWWCPNPACRRPRQLRSDRIAANLADMERRGVYGADI